MHGATYTVDAEFKSESLVPKSNWVVDIGAASGMLADVLAKYKFKNLNELFPGENTTTEFMCKASKRVRERGYTQTVSNTIKDIGEGGGHLSHLA